MIKKTKNHDKEIILDRGCIWAINQTRLKRNENNAIATKPTWGCNAIFDYTYRCEIKKIPQNIYIYIYSNWDCKFSNYDCHLGIDFV